MSIFDFFLNSSPYPEVLVRHFLFLAKKKGFFNSKHKGLKKQERGSTCTVKISSEGFFRHLKRLGIKQGDLLIVHSSTNVLSRLDCSGIELINGIKQLVGENGTLAFPAFPDETCMEDENGIKIYNPKRTIAWTGMLPNLLLRMKGSVRSDFPYNPLVSIGKNANEMMRNNLNTCYAHGPDSCWGYCVQHHAKVLFLGIPAFHSNTILHAIEDFQPGFFPDDWYDDIDYYVTTDRGVQLIHTKIRKQKWSRFVSEKYTENKYLNNGLMISADYESVPIRLINDCNVFLNSILNNWDKYRFYFFNKRMLHWDRKMDSL